MQTNALIIEQLEWNGVIKSFTLQAQEGLGQMWVAFPDEYDKERTSPFHFLDSDYENYFEQRKAKCRTAKLSSTRFYSEDNKTYFITTWNGIPSKRDELTFYSLYLPEFAVPDKIIITPTNNSDYEYNKTVYRDDTKNRYIIYLECRAGNSTFDFKLVTRFFNGEKIFYQTNFGDKHTIGFYESKPSEFWQHFITHQDAQKVTNIFNATIMTGDNYNVNQAGAVGPNSSATNNTFNQQINNSSEHINYDELVLELAKLKEELLKQAKLPEHYQAIGEIVSAEDAAKAKDGNKLIKHLTSAGKWVFDFATKVGTSVVAKIIEEQLK